CQSCVSEPRNAIAEAFVVRKAGAASTWPRWRGHVGSTGVEERSRGTGRIAWRPERSHSRPHEETGKSGGRYPKARAWKEPPTLQERCGEHEAGGIGWTAETNP